MNPTMEETMSIEAYTNGKDTLFRERRPVGDAIVKMDVLSPLGRKQIQWLESRFPGISRNRVSRLADHERASAARMEMSV